jgi:hypothetical protein
MHKFATKIGNRSDRRDLPRYKVNSNLQLLMIYDGRPNELSWVHYFTHWVGASSKLLVALKVLGPHTTQVG